MTIPRLSPGQSKTYVAAAGLFGLAVYQLSQGGFDAAAHSLMLALGMLGIHTTITSASK